MPPIIASDKIALVCICGFAVLFTSHGLIYGSPGAAHDTLPHSLLYLHFLEQLWEGELYPRWLSNMWGNLGSPGMFLIAPLPYYITAIFKPFFANDPYAWQQFALSAMLALAASGSALFLWLRRLVVRRAALIAAIL